MTARLARHRWAIALLAGGALLRLLLAYVVFPGQGFATDLSLFASWAAALARVGPGSFYRAVPSADYPPGYLYVLWAIGAVGSAIAPALRSAPADVVASMLKLPAIGADLAIAALLYAAGRAWRGERVGLIAAALYLFVPVTWYDSALWGQVDSVGALAMLAAVLLVIDGHSEAAAAMGAFSLLVKPQDLVVLVVLVPVLARRHLVADRSARRLATSALAAAAAFVIPLLPFDIARYAPSSLADLPLVGQVAGVVGLVTRLGGRYDVLTANAYNVWALVGPHPLAAGMSGGSWTPDSLLLFGAVPAVAAGAIALVAVSLLVAAGLLLRDDRMVTLLGFAVVAFAFYALPTRVHERYLFPFFVPAALLAAPAVSRALGYVAVALLNAVNVHAVLGAPLRIATGIGPGSRRFSGGPFPTGQRGPFGGSPGPRGFGPGGSGFGAGRALLSGIQLPLTSLARAEAVAVAVAVAQTLVLVALLGAWIAVVTRGYARRPSRSVSPSPAARLSAR